VEAKRTAAIAIAVIVSPVAVVEDEARSGEKNSHNAKEGMHAQEQDNLMD
jgi:hypothetical protein